MLNFSYILDTSDCKLIEKGKGDVRFTVQLIKTPVVKTGQVFCLILPNSFLITEGLYIPISISDGFRQGPI